jgi:hypothetical protein
MLKHRYSGAISATLPSDSPLRLLSRSPRKESKKRMTTARWKEQGFLEQKLKEHLVEEYVRESRAAGEEAGPIDADEMPRIVNMAIIELASIDIFRLSKKPVLHACKDVIAGDKRVVESSYLQYLSQNRVPNRIMFEFSRAMIAGMRANTDVVTRFQLREIGSVDAVINEILKKLRFKDTVTALGPRGKRSSGT